MGCTALILLMCLSCVSASALSEAERSAQDKLLLERLREYLMKSRLADANKRMSDADIIQSLGYGEPDNFLFQGTVLDEGGPNVLVKSMVFVVEGREDVSLDLTGDLSKLRNNPIVLKEGAEYRIKILFRVQREIVPGLRYLSEIKRKGIRVDKANYMVGSFGPKTELQVFTGPLEEVPSGMLNRGTYTVRSIFKDDNKNKYLEWDWSFKIKQEWE